MKKRLKILMICKTLPWQFKGGIQTHTWFLAKELANLGHQVTILTGGSYKQKELKYRKNKVNIVETPFFPGRRLKLFNIVAEEFSFNWKVKKWVQKNHKSFEIIHAQGRSGYLLYDIKEIHNKLVNTVHGLIDLETKRTSPFNLNKIVHALLAKRYENRLFTHSKKIIAVSKSLQKDLITIRSHKFKSTVVPNGIQKVGDPKVCKIKPPRYIFIGRLHPIKGILELVKAMAESEERIELDIIGNGKLKEKLQKAITKYKLEHRVRLLGEKSAEEIQELIPQYNALVLPSHYETQGIVILEANALGVPVIVSDIPAIRESVRHHHNGLLCDHTQPSAFIEAMEEMARNPIKARHMGFNGKKLVDETYDWKIISKSVEKIYLKLAG